MKIKVHYDLETIIVKGYYPDSVNYASIPEPYIEISLDEYKEALEKESLGKTFCIINGIFQEYIKPDSELLKEAIEAKKIEIKNLRTSLLAADILAKNIDGKSYYVKTDPEINLFSSAILMEESATRIWGCFYEGEKVLIELTKAELLSIANHYEVRKNQEYNLCDLRRAEVSLLTNIDAVNAFDINKVYEN
jgi:hypothetical protein